jgi:hypothetical protein
MWTYATAAYVIIAADSPGAFMDDTPTATFVRQVLGAVAQLDKAMTIANLRGARERKRREAGWCEGAFASLRLYGSPNGFTGQIP